MVHTFNAVEYLDYVRRSGRLLGIVTGTALAVTLVGSLLVPKEYTAMASIVIEPPGGSDPRAATAISPIYLESLKTYEQFASSDTLFARACEKFGLLESHGSPYIETFKQKVLRVTKLKETKILQISVTLRDRKQAQALVQFLAEETVNSSRRLSRQGDQEGIEEAKKRLEGTRAAVQRAREEAIAAAAGNAEASLTSEIENLAKLASTLRARLALARADARGGSGSRRRDGKSPAGEGGFASRRGSGAWTRTRGEERGACQGNSSARADRHRYAHGSDGI